MADTASAEAVTAQITLLGRFEIVVDGREIALRSANERALLARLALEPGTVVPVDALIEAIWPTEPQPNDPVKSLRFHIWHLRDLLEPERPGRSDGRFVRTRHGGYVLDVAADSVDAIRVECDWKRAQSIGDLASRRDLLVAALAQWQPAAFAERGVVGPLGDAATRLERLRLAALEDRIATDLELGRGAELVPELELLAAQHPFRERLIGHRMLALYRAGRQVDALAVYRDARRRLVDELGLEPGPELRSVEQRILAHDEQLAPPASTARRGPTSSPPRSGKLPLAVDSFVGRAADVDEIHRLLAKHRLVTLAGAGGTGKTRLATEASRAIRDRYPDGVWFVELALVTDPEYVPMAVAEMWDLRSGEFAVDDLVVDHLRHRELLLVIDNCEHMIEPVAALIRRLLQETPAVRVLATSRAALAVHGEVVVRVPSLEVTSVDGGPGPAIELFVERGQAVRAGWEPADAELAAVRTICERLDGIPLAVELVAARVRSMSPAELIHLLDDSLPALLGSNRTDVPRQQTLAATIDWSYQLLAEMEQKVFRRMSVFAGGFDLDAALAVCAEPTLRRPDVVDIVDALVDRSLVLAAHDPAGTRYRVLEPVRQWAAAQPGETGESETVLQRHAEHFAELVATLSPRLRGHGQVDAFRRIKADVPNLRIAFDTLADRRDVDRYLDMSFNLYSYWAHQGPYLEGFEICRSGLELASRVGADLERQVKVAFVATMCAGWMRRRVAFDFADRCRALAERLASSRAVGWAALVRAIVVVNDEGRLESSTGAAEHVLEARELFEAHPGPPWWDTGWERGFQQMLFAAFLTPSADRVAEFEESERILKAHGDEALLITLYSQCAPLVDFMGRDRVMELLARVPRTRRRRSGRIRADPGWRTTTRSPASTGRRPITFGSRSTRR